MPDLVNVADFESAAAQRLEPGAFGYFAGGAGDEWTLRENVAAFARWCLRPRVLVDVGAGSTATTVLGTEISMPLLVAPVALQRLAHPGGEPTMASAAARAGTLFCLSTLATSHPAEVAAQAPPGPRWFQVYLLRDRAVTDSLIEEAVANGFGALVLTVDAPRAGRRERDLRTGFAVPPDVDMPAVRAAVGGPSCPTPAEFFSLVDDGVTWSDVGALIERAPVPVVLKGIQTAEDARLACEHGASALVVSNHGGRQLDGVAATLDLLPEVVEAVEGRIEVLLDGGVRRGADVVKALALGARAVLAGRAPLWGLVTDGEQGALSVLELLREEIELSLALVGCRSPAEVTADHVARATGP
jgi:isopentenyl diphosphate isomerase/L-lactate dehydrogenase-like FMN-dependent dehydrogenase